MARDSERLSTWNIAPAFAPVDDVEVGVGYAKTRRTGTTEQAIQAKWRITPSQDNGCNLASTLGWVHEKNVGSSSFLVGIMSCNSSIGAVHINLTRHNPKNEASFTSWGVAFEQPMGGFIPHIEAFADQGQKATLQMGAKTDIREGLQLVATWGRDRQNRVNVFSIGVKQAF